MQWGGVWCLRRSGAAAAGVSDALWKKWMRGARRAGRVRRVGGNGREALLAWEAVPERWRGEIVRVCGLPGVGGSEAGGSVGEAGAVAEDLRGWWAEEAGLRVWLWGQSGLTDGQRVRYALNGETLGAAMRLAAALEGEGCREVRVRVAEAVARARAWQERELGMGHGLPGSVKRLWAKLESWREAEAGEARWRVAMDGRAGNGNARRVRGVEQEGVLEMLLGWHTNLNDAQVALMYNEVAARRGWPRISVRTVGRKRREVALWTYGQRHGEGLWRSRVAMQVKRRAPGHALYYWSVDGWEAELLYQREELRGGRVVRTYHNRLTVVVVLDPVGGMHYPVGYAIGEAETSELIREALREALRHVRELTGRMLMPLQLQTDRFGNGALRGLYEAVSGKWTPARVGNAKAKVVERYFSYLNERYCKLQDNWSGYGVTVRREKQPNEEWLEKMKRHLPDAAGCREQLRGVLEAERKAKGEAYRRALEAVPECDRRELGREVWLRWFGERTAWAYKLQPGGLRVKVRGEEVVWDSWDVRLREAVDVRWVVYYDPEDLSEALAVSARVRGGKAEEDGRLQVKLERVREQPMALRERTEGDAAALARVAAYNRDLEVRVVERMGRVREAAEGVLRGKEADGTLAKLLLTNSLGMHKAERQWLRGAAAEEGGMAEAGGEIVEDDVRDMY